MKIQWLRNVPLILTLLITALPAQATDLLPIFSSKRLFVFQGELTPVEVTIRNDNILQADFFTSTVRIEDATERVVYESQVDGTDLPPFTEQTLGLPLDWKPLRTGVYRFWFGVDFADDIDTSNNSLTTDIAVVIDYNDALMQLSDHLDQREDCDPNTMVAFMPHQPFAPGTTIETDNEVTNFQMSMTLNNYQYFAYLDCDPSAKYTHPGAFITIDGIDSTVNWTDVDTWPVIDGNDYMDDPILRLDTEDFAYGSLPEVETVESFNTITQSSPPVAPPGKTCAILVSGKIRKDWERASFNFDLDLMEGNLMNESLGLQLPGANIQRIGNATKGEICEAIDKAKTGYDKIIFYYSGHGNKGWMVTNDGIANQLLYIDLATKLYSTDADDISVIIDACYAGSAEGSFRIPYEFTKKKVTLVLAAMSTKTSLSRVIQRTSGGDPVWAGFFTWHFARCYGDPAAESDGQAGISFAEAFNWVREQNPMATDGRINRLQNPQLVQNMP